MFDYQVSKQAHYEEACRRFATKHNIKQLSADVGMSAQVLRNKLNPDQPHRLTVVAINPACLLFFNCSVESLWSVSCSSLR